MSKYRNTANVTTQWNERRFPRYPKIFALSLLLCNKMAKSLFKDEVGRDSEKITVGHVKGERLQKIIQ